MLKPSKLSFSKAAPISVGLLATALSLAVSSCSTHNVHKNLTQNPRVLQRDWTLATHGPFEAGDHGAEYSNPILYENTLLFGTRSQGLISVYPGLLQTHWKLPIKNGIVSALEVDKGSVFFGGGDGFLYSVNVDNGRVNWRYDLHNPIISKPTIEGGRLFLTTSDDTVYAFDAGTGKWLWHYRRRSSPAATILGASAPLVDGNEVLAGLSDGFLVSLSLNDGQLKWEKKLHQGTRFTDVDAHPLLDKGILYVPSYDGSLFALKRAGGDTLWRFDAGGSKQVVLQDRFLYFPSTDGNVYCLQKDSAKVIWKFDLDSGTPTHLILTDKYVIVGSSYQFFYVLDKGTGKPLYRYNAGQGSGFSGQPAFDPATQRVYALSGAGNLYAFKITQPVSAQLISKGIDPYLP